MVVLIQVRDRHDKWPSVFASARRLWAGRSVEERLVRSEPLSGNLCRTDRFRPSAARTAAATFCLCTVRFRSCASKRRPVKLIQSQTVRHNASGLHQAHKFDSIPVDSSDAQVACSGLPDDFRDVSSEVQHSTVSLREDISHQ